MGYTSLTLSDFTNMCSQSEFRSQMVGVNKEVTETRVPGD